MMVSAQGASSTLVGLRLVRRWSRVTPLPVSSSVTTISFSMPVPGSTGCVSRMLRGPDAVCAIGVLSGP